jgi:hypothetical protein
MMILYVGVDLSTNGGFQPQVLWFNREVQRGNLTVFNGGQYSATDIITSLI